MYVEYSANNSGGHWWLTDEDWYALEKAGWKIAWNKLYPVYDTSGKTVRDENGIPVYTDAPSNPDTTLTFFHKGEERFLGTLAQYAYLKCNNMEEAVNNWEEITGKNSCDAGCPCCGQPHNFTLYDNNNNYVTSGPRTSYEVSW